MALTDVAQVRRLGSIQELDAYRLFRVADDPAVIVLVQEAIDIAAAWIEDKAPDTYALAVAGTPARLKVIFQAAEAYRALTFLGEELKARKVEGTHAEFDSEESDSYARMIDTEWKTLMEELIGDYLTVDSDERPIAFPTFSVGPAIDRFTDTTIDTPLQELEEIAWLSRS